MQRLLLLLLPVGLLGCGEVSTSGNDHPPPTIESVSPDRGGVQGRTQITLTGSGFMENGAGDNYVIVNGWAAADVQTVDDSTITFTLPAGEPDALVDVLVFNDNGFATLSNAIRYNVPPIITSISPNFVKAGGGTVSIFGQGFEAQNAGQNAVTVGGVEAASVTVVSDNQVDVTLEARPDDVLAFEYLEVAVTNDNGMAARSEGVRYTGQGLITVARSSGYLTPGLGVFFVDLESDPVRTVRIASVPFIVQSATLGPDGKIWVIYGRCRNPPLQQLATFEPATGELDIIGPLREGGTTPRRLRGLAFADGDLVSHSQDLQGLVRIDTETGSFSEIGAATDGITSMRALAPLNANSVYRARTTLGSLESVSTVDSTSTALVAMTGTNYDAQVTDMFVDGTDLYVLTRQSPIDGDFSSSGIVRYNVSTGTGVVETLISPRQLSMVPTPADY